MVVLTAAALLKLVLVVVVVDVAVVLVSNTAVEEKDEAVSTVNVAPAAKTQ